MVEENGAPSSDAPAKVPGQAGSPTQENGLKECAPCGSQGIHDPQGFDSRIPETSKCAVQPEQSPACPLSTRAASHSSSFSQTPIP